MKIEVAVADTHALIYYISQRWKRLGSRARQVFREAEEGRAAIYIPTVGLVELADAYRRGEVELSGGVAAWTEGMLSTGTFIPVDLSVEIFLRAEELYAIPERTDRLIAATAVHLECPLLTRDHALQDLAGVQVIW